MRDEGMNGDEAFGEGGEVKIILDRQLLRLCSSQHLSLFTR